jgi:hypothetical protein
MNFAHYDPIEFIVLSVVFALIVLCWIVYTRRLKTPRNTGTQEGIAIATEQKERGHKTGSL